MNMITFSEQAKQKTLTMSSRLIAELNLDVSKFAHIYIDTMRYAQNWTHPQNDQSYNECLLLNESNLNVLKTERIYTDTMKRSNFGSNKEIEA